MNTKASLYETFSAKYLSYQEVADLFVPNEEFHQLLGNNHTLVMGPRGCGKTTLLKMLTPAALFYWKSPQSIEIKSSIPFTSIYVPSDIQWKSQLAFLNKHLQKNKEFNEKIVDFLITTNVQVALCRTAYSLIHLGESYEPHKKLLLEDSVCKSFIDIWNIEKPLTASFDDIEIALQKRVVYVKTIVNKVIFQKSDNNGFQDLPDYAYNDFLDVIKMGCNVIEKQLKLPENHRWALCFDELEISPKFLQLRLFSFLRSVDQKFLFKLTTTPLVNLENEVIEASQDNDFKTVKLWVHDESGSKKWREFSNILVAQKLNRKYLGNSKSPEDCFGTYSLDGIIRDELNLKRDTEPGSVKGSSVYYLFKALAESDPSFFNYLVRRNIDPLDPYSKKRNDNKSIFLKNKVNALYRYIFRSRTRKNPPINYGIPYIYDICDGNPRSLIGLIDEMLLKDDGSFYTNNQAISFSRQSEIILEASKKYYNLTKNHPDSTLTIRNEEYNLSKHILAPIGNYIYSKIVKEDFSQNVPTTFMIDNEIDHKITKLLEHALYLGAIVYLDPIESLSNSGLIGKRFRLSYLFAPLFRIPNRVNSFVNLKVIFNETEEETLQTEIDFN